jgi:hypothetical protein
MRLKPRIPVLVHSQVQRANSTNGIGSRKTVAHAPFEILKVEQAQLTQSNFTVGRDDRHESEVKLARKACCKLRRGRCQQRLFRTGALRARGRTTPPVRLAPAQFGGQPMLRTILALRPLKASCEF